MADPLSALRMVATVPLAAITSTYAASTRVVRAGQDLLRAAEQFPGLLARIDVILSAAEAAVGHVEAVTRAAADVASRVDGTRATAQNVADRAADLERRMTAMADRVQPLFTTLGAVGSDTGDEAASLIERSLPLLDQVEKVVMPLVREIRDAVPELRDILPIVQRLEPVMVDVETRIAGLPGASRMLKRGEKELDSESDAEDADSDDAVLNEPITEMPAAAEEYGPSPS